MAYYIRLPTIDVMFGDKKAIGFVDTRCTTILITPNLATTWSGRKNLIAIDEIEVGSKGISTIELTVLEYA